MKQHDDNLEYTDIIVNPLLLVLCYAFCNPSDVSDFLDISQFHTALPLVIKDIPVLAA
jgi:hypothetical protein